MVAVAEAITIEQKCRRHTHTREKEEIKCDQSKEMKNNHFPSQSYTQRTHARIHAQTTQFRIEYDRK